MIRVFVKVQSLALGIFLWLESFPLGQVGEGSIEGLRFLRLVFSRSVVGAVVLGLVLQCASGSNFGRRKRGQRVGGGG